jgi:DNA adenine methylase
MKIPHPIPYQGSKRQLASSILMFFPSDVEVFYEPFAGSASVTIAAAAHQMVHNFVLNDLNAPLINLWRDIINRPEGISSRYSKLWQAQVGKEREFYDFVRSMFNQTGRTDCLLYLLARCVKAAVRYNSNGEFNQSPDNRRKGMKPQTLEKHIHRTSLLLKNKTQCFSQDYKAILYKATAKDLIYLDPPYQGVSGKRDPRYFERISFDEFVSSLAELNRREISYLVSYDGRRENKAFGQPLPPFLDLQRVELFAGRSSQSTLLGRNEHTYEALYLSPALVARKSRVATTSKSHRVSSLQMEAVC